MDKTKLLQMVIGWVLSRMSSEDVRKWVDAGIDILEDKVEASESKVDDIVILPALKMVREVIGIPDND